MSETALARPTPRIDHPDELERMVRQIVERVDPVAIYLFGSRARGDAREDSDYDLMVVIPDERMNRKVWDELLEARRASRLGVELVPSRASAFDWRRHEVGTLQYEVEADGIQLYPRPERHARKPTSARPGSMNKSVVSEWLRRVDRDLSVARVCCKADEPLPDQAAYHVQQAAEKLTKAALVAHVVRPRKGHKIQEFTPLLPQSFPLKDRFRRLERFSDYAWAHRYPEEPGQEPIPEPSVAEAEAWLDEVAALKADFERWLEARRGKADT